MPNAPKTMVKSVTVQNFKCLGDIRVDLEPLTVLIGKNDTGKTSFLEAIGYLAGAMSPRARQVFGIARPLTISDIVKHGADVKQCAISEVLGDGLRLEARASQHQFQSHGDSNAHARLQHVQFPYRFDLAQLRAPAQVGALGKAPLPPNGASLVAAVDRLPYKRFTQLQNELMSRIPLVQELRPTTLEGSPGAKEIWFDVKGAGLVPGREISDGVMLVLAILTVLYDENAPPLLMLEEPETGIHPKQLERLVEAFDAIAAQGTQIIVSTHSPYLLDFVPKESVRVFSRGDDGEVVVKPLSSVHEIRDMMSKGYTLGEAWYNSDEDAITSRDSNARRSNQ